MQSHPSGRSIERLSVWQRWEHAAMAISILFLILSGLALVYHAHSWARIFIGMMGGLRGRYLVHRIASIGLLVSGLSHVLSIIFSERHRRDFREVLPQFSDFAQAWQGLIFAIRGKGQPPDYGWFTPMQKFQYWGVLLGCVLMGVSGALLWNPVLTLMLFPKWILDIMLVLHAKEAQLIFVVFILWHLYDIHIASGNFPMNPSWLTGKMPVEAFANQHRASWDAMHHKEDA